MLPVMEDFELDRESLAPRGRPRVVARSEDESLEMKDGLLSS